MEDKRRERGRQKESGCWLSEASAAAGSALHGPILILSSCPPPAQVRYLLSVGEKNSANHATKNLTFTPNIKRLLTYKFSELQDEV